MFSATRRLPRIALLSLVGCAIRPDDSAAPEAQFRGGPVADDAWAAVAGARIANDARAIQPGQGGEFVAELPGAGLVARFGADGVRVGEANENSSPLTLRFTAWGREGAIRSIDATQPALGACAPTAGMGADGECVRQLEYGHQGVTAWWIGIPGGVEQGWTMAEPPAGVGDIVFETTIGGASALDADGDSAWFTDDAGRAWAVSGVTAWDARGEPLAALLEAGEGRLRVVVDASGAEWPVTVDPVYTTAATSLTGGASSDRFGWRASSAGDVNNDGYDDVIVGAPRYSSSTGRVYVYHGSSTGLSTTATTTITGGLGGELVGYCVAGAGDVNNDGYDDIIYGSYGYTSSRGRAYVHHGSASGISTTATTTITGSAASDQLGLSVAGAGDVNHDGYDDVIIGAPGVTSSTGKAYVFHGSSSGVSTTATSTLTGAGTTYYFGYSVASAGDVNGDSYDDVIVGAYGALTNTGKAYVHYGASGGVSTTAASSFSGSNTNNYFGYSVSSAGDVNADGYDDVLVGAYGATTSTGRVYAYVGSASGLSGFATTIDGGVPGDQFGTAVARAGDVNNDGYDDIIVGAPGYSTSTGRAYVYHGGSAGVTTTVAATLTGSTTSNYFGNSVAGGGDISNDGYDDVVVGAYGYSSSTGAVYIYRGYPEDSDGDGFTVDIDCNDADSAVGVATNWYTDADSDGYGSSSATAVAACTAPSGSVASHTDCNDAVAAINPGATETCDASNTDEDCDGAADDLDTAATGKSTYYADSDGDSYGAGAALTYCDAPSGVVTNATDCNDTSAAINPAATEACDAANTDEDCDGAADDNDTAATGKGTYYIDSDGDSYGAAAAVTYCDPPANAVTNASDCDDTAASVHPGGTEVCDAANADEDCDGSADDADSSVTGRGTYYTDADGDTYGAGSAQLFCDPAVGLVTNVTDCNDAAAAINPGATEVCDAANTDEDCDGNADDLDTAATGKGTWYVDSDTDGYGAGSATQYCDAPAGTVTNSTDCNDAASAIHPGATEVCDAANTDEDCDGAADDADTAATGKSTYYADSDGDGYGAGTASSLCDAPAASASSHTDCDDTDDTINPGATETVGDEVDSDCDGDELCFSDGDADGYLPDTARTTTSSDEDCSDVGEGSLSTPAGDCDDGDAAYHPSADESDCSDPADYNCDGSTGYSDDDADGYAACDECDDTDDTVYPGAREYPGDLIDQDCDGVDTCYLDVDNDGYRPDGIATVLGGSVTCDGSGEALASDPNGDCDDADSSIHPDATEGAGDEIDSDCDGTESCLADADNDGYSDEAGSVVASSDVDCADAGEASARLPAGDCDESSDLIHPGAPETDCTDTTDYNCDGSVGRVDDDGDGFAACEECDDTSAAVNPSATEVCNDIDDDCDVDVDEEAADALTYYADADGDTWTTLTSIDACEAPDGYTDASVSEDCDDTSDSVYPTASEIIGDGIDQDCDGIDPAGADTGDTGPVIIDTGDTGLPVDTSTPVDTADTSTPVDTADTTDTGDTGDTVDTGDTGVVIDTGPTDTADTADSGDTADTADSASDDAGEDSGKKTKADTCGCAAESGPVAASLLPGLAALLTLRRRRGVRK